MQPWRNYSLDELQALPAGAILYDAGWEVWRHGVGLMRVGKIIALVGDDWSTRDLWQKIGDAGLYFTGETGLLASRCQLLDDGL